MRYCLFIAAGDIFGWAGNDGEGRTGWMRCCLVGWALSMVSLTDEEVSLDRLYNKGRVLGHKRAKRNSHPNTSLLQIEGVGSKEEAQFYLGKVRRSPRILRSANIKLSLHYQRVAYVYKAKKERQGSKVRVIWGYAFPFTPLRLSPVF